MVGLNVSFKSLHSLFVTTRQKGLLYSLRDRQHYHQGIVNKLKRTHNSYTVCCFTIYRLVCFIWFIFVICLFSVVLLLLANTFVTHVENITYLLITYEMLCMWPQQSICDAK